VTATRLRELWRGGRSESGGQGVTKALVRPVSDPRDMSIGPDQDGNRSSDHAEHRELPYTRVASVDQPNVIPPWGDVEGTGLTEVEHDRSGIVAQGERSQRAVGG
jgi:hypothetical protein